MSAYTASMAMNGLNELHAAPTANSPKRIPYRPATPKYSPGYRPPTPGSPFGRPQSALSSRPGTVVSTRKRPQSASSFSRDSFIGSPSRATRPVSTMRPDSRLASRESLMSHPDAQMKSGRYSPWDPTGSLRPSSRASVEKDDPFMVRVEKDLYNRRMTEFENSYIREGIPPPVPKTDNFPKAIVAAGRPPTPIIIQHGASRFRTNPFRLEAHGLASNPGYIRNDSGGFFF